MLSLRRGTNLAVLYSLPGGGQNATLYDLSDPEWYKGVAFWDGTPDGAQPEWWGRFSQTGPEVNWPDRSNDPDWLDWRQTFG